MRNVTKKKYGLKKNSVFIFFCSLTLFLLFCLLSYSSHDVSFLHKTLLPIQYHNWFGAWGAYTASLLIFLFGGIGSFLCLGFLIFCLSCRYLQQPIKNNCDQYIAWFFLLVTGMAGSYILQFDFFASQIPGGIIGKYTANLVQQFLDPLLCTVFIIVVCLSSLCIITRLFFVTAGIALLQFLIMNGFISYGATMLYQFIKSVIVWGTFPILWCVKKSFAYFDDTSLTHTAQELIIEDLEAETEESKDICHEKFWQTYLVHEVQKLHNHDLAVDHEKSEEEIAFSASSVDHSENRPSPVIQESKKKSLKFYQIPLVSWFRTDSENNQEIKDNHKILATILEEKLERFGIRGQVTSIKVGPVITLFEYQPEIDSKISKIIALEDDLALALQALSIRIIAPIPGRSVVGFEVSNKQRRTVLLGQVLQSSEFKNSEGHLPLVLGQDSIGSTVIVDLATMPHLLVAGSTGSGKSVALNAMLVSLLCKHTPETLKLILIDPKRLEFASYADIPHLLVPIVTDPRKAALVLKWVVKTMEERYALMEEANVRNIFDYHELLKAGTG